MSDVRLITTRAEALEAWDKSGVIIRQEEGYVFVYPMLGRGVKYPNFDLRRDCFLNTFTMIDKAISWSKSKGYKYVLMK